MSIRHLGLEQELFIVESGGESSDRADELIQHCRKKSKDAAVPPHSFEGEWVRNILEIKTSPAKTPAALADAYLRILQVAIEAAGELNLRLYPLASYPLHLIPQIRDAANNHVQVRTIGRDRFLNAGKCTGVHLHIELPEGTIDPVVAVRYDTGAEARAEVLNAYNLGTAIDPVLIALGRSCPFYEGASTGLAYHTSRYRGSQQYGWDGVYTQLPEVGALRPYAATIEELVHLQFERHFAWLEAMKQANVDRKLFCTDRGNLLKSSWNPIRLNAHGTIEHRNIDSNLPAVVLGLTLLLHEVHSRIRDDRLTVTPEAGVREIVIEGGRLLVPEFAFVNHDLFYAAVTEGNSNALVSRYTQSVRQLIDSSDDYPEWLEELMPHADHWRTTEDRLLEQYYPTGEQLTLDDGLRMVREVSAEFAQQVETLREHTARYVQPADW